MESKRFLFRKHQKITTTKEFQKVFNLGRRQFNPYFKLHYFVDKNQPTKIGVIISRKIKGAVIRNRYKRIIRELSRSIYSQLVPGTWLVVVLASNIKPCYCEMEESLLSLIKRANILYNDPKT